MNAIPPIAGKVPPLVHLLGSPVDAEALAACHALGRTLASADMDFHDLAETIELSGLPVVVEQPRQEHEPEPELREWQGLAHDCLRRGAGRLSDAEMDFARSMVTWPSEPSARQWRWLSAIALSLGLRGAGMNLMSMARALGGVVVGQEVLCPGPGHSPKDRSLSVKIDVNSPDLFIVHSFAKDDFRECRDYVKQRLGLPTSAPPRSRSSTASSPARWTTSPTSTTTGARGPSDTDRRARALAIWQEAGKLDGSTGSTWLFRRGVNLGALPRDLHRALRWHPGCPWEGGRYGCMVGLFTDAVTGEPTAIHRTAITPAGDKVGRKALGPIAGCVIRLWPDEDVVDGVVIGEGIETTLAAATCIEHQGTLLQPAWAAGFAGNMAKLPVLGGVEALTLLVDNDASGTGQRAAEECSARWTTAGREVIRLVPRQVGTDFNDIVEVPHA